VIKSVKVEDFTCTSGMRRLQIERQYAAQA